MWGWQQPSGDDWGGPPDSWWPSEPNNGGANGNVWSVAQGRLSSVFGSSASSAVAVGSIASLGDIHEDEESEESQYNLMGESGKGVDEGQDEWYDVSLIDDQGCIDACCSMRNDEGHVGNVVEKVWHRDEQGVQDISTSVGMPTSSKSIQVPIEDLVNIVQ